ncbi:MAG: YbbR-like domain-containing protein [Acidobacteriota bacterium]
MVRKNLFLKLASLSIAFGLWAWVASQGELFTTVQVPMQLTGVPSGRTISGEPPATATVSLRGPEIALRNLAPERIRLEVDLSKQPLKVGENPIVLDLHQVHVPAGITVVGIKPKVVKVNIEREMRREVPVTPEIQGEPAPGYEVTATIVQPPRITITGPESVVSRVESLSTTAIGIAGLSRDQHLSVPAYPLGKGGNLIEMDNVTGTVDVLVRIRPIKGERLISGVPVDMEGVSADGAQPRLEPSSVVVKVVGPRKAVEALTPQALRAVVNLEGSTDESRQLSPSDFTVQLRDPAPGSTEDLTLKVTGPPIIRLTWTKPVHA